MLARLPDWLVLGQEDWDEVERRNQLLLLALANRHPRSRFLFAELPTRARGLLGARPLRVRQVAENVWCMRPLRPFPDRLSAFGSVNDRIEARLLRRALRKVGIERPAFWSQDPRAGSVLAYLEVGRIVFDLTDDWAAFEADPARRRAVEERVAGLVARADLVLACSRPLERDARRHGARVEYLPNAVEAPGPTQAVPLELERPVLGYAGTLHDARLDVELVRAAAELRPGWSFAFLGPDLLDPASRQRLFELPNVHHLGVRPHREVRAYLEAFDVCLVPHRVTAFTRSLDPLKVYEYLAAGKPVVTTPTGNAPDLAEHLLVAATADELVVKAEHALAEDGAAGRRAAVAGETWECRAQQLEAALGVERPPVATDVSVVVVSHNTRELLARTLEALADQRGVDAELIVVDNASSDGSVKMVRNRFPDATVLALDENVGFARANNLAFQHCRGEFVLLLNSDCFLDLGALAALVAAARRLPSAAAVGPRLSNPDGTLQRSAWPFPRASRLLLESLALHRPLARLGLMEDLRLWAHDEERPVDFLIGACLLLRREALTEVDGFDEDFWLYGEEADLCRRLARRGWQVVLAPAARAVHVGGASSGVSRERLRHFYRGQKRFLQKHGRRGAWPLARMALLVGSALRGRWRVVRLALDPRL
jgi:GT2 family glycosyltransferase/glycosyltransferase involved in cell wall biosynthesis